MTNLQKNCLLKYLGYLSGAVGDSWSDESQQATMNFQNDYELAVDGIFGPMTEAKIKEVIYNNQAPIKNYVESSDESYFWSGIKHFTKDEFKCKCGGRYCNGFPSEPNHRLVWIADEVREHYGKPAIVTSGLRCMQHNANTSGAVWNSKHLTGEAMDFRIKGVSSMDVISYIQSKYRGEIKYIYSIDESHLHMNV